MTTSEIIKNIQAKKYSPVYLLHGEEAYYIDYISDLIEEKVLNDAEKSFNQSILYGKETDVNALLNTVKRYPMMAEHQIVIVKEAQDFKFGKETEDKKAPDPLAAYCQNPLTSTILVFCHKHGKFDKRKKLYKIIEKTGVVFESAPLYENKIPAWIEDYIRNKGYRINPRAVALIAEYLGTDLSKIANELEKLLLNINKEKEITIKEVQDNIGISKEYNVFELQQALAQKDAYRANQIINYFEANPKANPVQLVMGNLNTYFTKLLKYHYTDPKSPQNLAKELGINPYFVKDFETAARSFPVAKTFNILSDLRIYDLKTKGLDATANTENGNLLRELIYKIIH